MGESHGCGFCRDAARGTASDIFAEPLVAVDYKALERWCAAPVAGAIICGALAVVASAYGYSHNGRRIGLTAPYTLLLS